jgi:hypothetical protein
MPKAKCNYLLPSSFGYIGGGWPPEHPECLLAEHHAGEHLGSFEDGTYIAWESAETCDCTPQELQDVECECFIYRPVSTFEAIRILAKEGPGK